MADRRCQRRGCGELPDAAWTFCAEHMAEEEARGAAWARGVAVPRDVTPTDQLTYTRTVELTFDRGAGPLLPQPIHNARVTRIRLTYTYVSPISGWTAEIGPVHGHVINDEGRLGTRIRSLRPLDHSPHGWPTWMLALAEAHQPQSRITVTEENPS